MKYAQLVVRILSPLFFLCAAVLPLGAQADEYSEVMQLTRDGKYTDAMNKADAYLAGRPRDPQMRFLKGVAQKDAGKNSDAITTFSKLTEEFPELPEPYNNLAVLYANQNQFDKAKSALEMALKTNPGYAIAYENLGDVYAKLSSQAYNKALQIEGTNPAISPKLALVRQLFNSSNGRLAPLATSTGPASTCGVTTCTLQPLTRSPAASTAACTARSMPPACAGSRLGCTLSSLCCQRSVKAGVTMRM